MNTFRFRLQRVLDYRRTQFQIAESACQRAGARVHAIRAQQAALAYRKSETRKAFARLPEVAGQDLESLPGWYKWTDTQSAQLIRLEHAAAQEPQKRREAMVEAQRKVRLLEKLHDNRKAQWQSDFDREVEEQAADAFRARAAGFSRPAKPSLHSPSHPSTGTAGPETCT
jgi:flagellar export protein FliJ